MQVLSFVLACLQANSFGLYLLRAGHAVLMVFIKERRGKGEKLIPVHWAVLCHLKALWFPAMRLLRGAKRMLIWLRGWIVPVAISIVLFAVSLVWFYSCCLEELVKQVLLLWLGSFVLLSVKEFYDSEKSRNGNLIKLRFCYEGCIYKSSLMLQDLVLSLTGVECSGKEIIEADSPESVLHLAEGKPTCSVSDAEVLLCRAIDTFKEMKIEIVNCDVRGILNPETLNTFALSAERSLLNLSESIRFEKDLLRDLNIVLQTFPTLVDYMGKPWNWPKDLAKEEEIALFLNEHLVVRTQCEAKSDTGEMG